MSLRSKALILTIAYTLAFGILQLVEIPITGIEDNSVLAALLLASFFLVGLYWVLDFRIKGIRYVTVLGYASFIVFVFSLFLELIVFQDTERISEKTLSVLILILFGTAIHFLILTMNILNVSYISKIPLAQAAKASNFLYTLFGSYFSFLLVLRSGAHEVIKISILTLTVLLLTLNIMWFKKESRRQLIGETSAVVLLMFTLSLLFSIWPLSAEVLAMFFTVIFYILLNLGLEERETTSLLMRIEYILLFLVAAILLLVYTSWGINGTFL